VPKPSCSISKALISPLKLLTLSLAGLACAGCVCCPEIASLRSEPAQICEGAGPTPVDIRFEVVYRKKDLTPCAAPQRSLYALLFADDSAVGGDTDDRWVEERQRLMGRRSNVMVTPARNRIVLSMPGRDGCPTLEDGSGFRGDRRALLIPVVECSGPGDDVSPGDG
jgi:hypothetical protein